MFREASDLATAPESLDSDSWKSDDELVTS
jgi:hypothetical protein